jgi:hypothetical protein
MRNSVFLSAVVGVLFGLTTVAQADTTLEDVREKCCCVVAACE